MSSFVSAAKSERSSICEDAEGVAYGSRLLGSGATVRPRPSRSTYAWRRGGTGP